MASMSDAQTHIAQTVQELSDDTRTLVRAEVDAARRELMDRLSAEAPGAALATAAGGLGVLAAASPPRMGLRLLQRRPGPVGAAFTAPPLYTAAAVTAAVGAYRLLRAAPAPWPAATARQTVVQAAESAAH